MIFTKISRCHWSKSQETFSVKKKFFFSDPLDFDANSTINGRLVTLYVAELALYVAELAFYMAELAFHMAELAFWVDFKWSEMAELAFSLILC